MDKKMLLVGDTPEVKELAAVLQRDGAEVTIVPDSKAGLVAAKELLPDVITFVVPVYWENLLPFLEAVRADPRLETRPIVYVGSDVMEGADQTMLSRKGVHTITLGPVPINEIARYVMSLG